MSQTRLPDIPSAVETEHIQSNGMLYTDKEIKLIKDATEKLDDHQRLGKLELNIAIDYFNKNKTTIKQNELDQLRQSYLEKPFPLETIAKYGILIANNNYYAIYHGDSKRQLEQKDNGDEEVKRSLDEDDEVEKKSKLGSSGKVKYAQNLTNGRFFALKIILAQHFSPTEFNLLKELGEVECNVITRTKNEKNYCKRHILMNYAHGKDLADIVLQLNPDHETYNINSPYAKLSLLHVVDMMIQLVEQTQALHALNILHRDLKVENMIFNAGNNEVKIVDHGHSIKCDNDEMVIYTKTIFGSDDYAAPETRYSGIKTYSVQSDIYSLGLSLLHIISAYQNNMELSEELSLKELEEETEKLKLKLIAKHMCRHHPEDRTSLGRALTSLRQSRERIAKQSPLRIAFIPIDELKKSDEEKIDLKSMIYDADEVYLLSAGNADLKNLIEISRRLGKRNILRSDLIEEKDIDTFLAKKSQKEQCQIIATKIHLTTDDKRDELENIQWLRECVSSMKDKYKHTPVLFHMHSGAIDRCITEVHQNLDFKSLVGCLETAFDKRNGKQPCDSFITALNCVSKGENYARMLAAILKTVYESELFDLLDKTSKQQTRKHALKDLENYEQYQFKPFVAQKTIALVSTKK